MPVGTNLERRGAVYYWRRRIPPRLVKAGGRSHLRMSLRTKEPAQARALAARLDATAMEVFMSDDAPALSQQQLEAIFQQVLRDHARKLDTIRAMELRDGLTDPDVLAREDHAAGLAYTIVARRGAAATVTTAERRRLAAAGEAETMIDDVTTLLAEMRRNGQTNASIGRLKALIEAVGALATPANVAVAERAYLRALGEALLGSAAASNAGLAQTVAIVPQAPVETSPAAAVVEASAVVAEPQRDVPSAVAGAGQRSIASAPSDKAEPSDYIGTVTEVAQELIRKKSKADWTPKTQSQAEMIFELFDRFLRQERGVERLQDLRQADLVAFDRLLDVIPKSFGKSPRDKLATITDIRRSSEAKKPEERGLAAGTRNRHITFLTMLLDTADSMGIGLADKLSFKGFRVSNGKRARDQKPIPPEGDVERLFRHPIFTGCLDWNDIHEPGSLVFHRAAYFGPMLAHYHGLRREEFCGLHVDDVVSDAAVPYLNIRVNAFRGLKNVQSQRELALHSEILRLGFLDYVQAVRELGYQRVFPELFSPSSRSPSGDRFYDEVSPAMRACGFTTHQIRHFFNNTLKQAGVHAEIRADLMGHGGETETTERYADAANSTLQLDAIAKLRTPTSVLEAVDIRIIPWVIAKQIPPWSKAAQKSKAQSVRRRRKKKI